jgi:hypothetical protein
MSTMRVASEKMRGIAHPQSAPYRLLRDTDRSSITGQMGTAIT